MTVEEKLKQLILENYKSIREFTNEIDIPYSTFDSILKRGISNANITNILKICKELHIDAESLADGNIVSTQVEPQTTATTYLDGDNFTEEQWKHIKSFAEFIKTEE